MTTRADFIRSLLGAGHWPPHLNNFVALTCWMEAEGIVARFNPLATTQPAAGATNFNSTAVKNYTSLEQGLAMTLHTILNGRYNDVINSLVRHDSAYLTLGAVERSSWGTHFADLSSFIENVRGDWSRYGWKLIPDAVPV